MERVIVKSTSNERRLKRTKKTAKTVHADAFRVELSGRALVILATAVAALLTGFATSCLH
jgi:hypothetical protein